MLLVEIIRQRLIEKRRMELITEVAKARQAYQTGINIGDKTMLA